MKNRIHKVIAFVAVSLLSVSGLALEKVNQQADVYVSTGFPYENLVKRFDTVKIHYLDPQDNLLRCRVELISGSSSTVALSQTISEKNFNETPLKSCISRKEAIAALATTY